jgi:hypothetical protein
MAAPWDSPLCVTRDVLHASCPLLPAQILSHRARRRYPVPLNGAPRAERGCGRRPALRVAQGLQTSAPMRLDPRGAAPRPMMYIHRDMRFHPLARLAPALAAVLLAACSTVAGGTGAPAPVEDPRVKIGRAHV